MTGSDRVLIRVLITEAPGSLGFDIPNGCFVELDADGGYAHGW